MVACMPGVLYEAGLKTSTDFCCKHAYRPATFSDGNTTTVVEAWCTDLFSQR